jgi:hypothetical protein
MPSSRPLEHRSLGQGLFAPRQVYVRNGAASQYVTLSRGLQVAVAAGLAIAVLWLGVASWAAVAKHLETVQQSRELARLEGIAQSLRTTIEGAQSDQPLNEGAAATADLQTELAAVRSDRERALALARAAAGEAAELRREVTLANQRVDELRRALVQAETGSPSAAELLGGAAPARDRPVTAIAAEPR